MKVKATVSMCGKICMAKDEIKDIPNGDVLKDLLRCGYVKEVKSSASSKITVEEEKGYESESDYDTDGKKVSWKSK